MKKWNLLLPLALILAACNWALYAPQPIGVTEAPAPTAAAATPTALPSPTPFEGRAVARGQNTPRRAVVCTGNPHGALNVRMCAGTECWAFFVLAEGREVILDGQEETTPDGATWVHLTRPADGWVNARYLCMEGGK